MDFSEDSDPELELSLVSSLMEAMEKDKLIKEHSDVLEKLVTKFNYTIQHVASTGDCFFVSTVNQLPGTDNDS